MRKSGPSPVPLSYSEIESWANLTRVRLLTREVEVIVRLDALLAEVVEESLSGR